MIIFTIIYIQLSSSVIVSQSFWWGLWGSDMHPQTDAEMLRDRDFNRFNVVLWSPQEKFEW